MKIIHIASEISPLAKVGGLADVVYGLAKATMELGHDVTVIIPAYKHLLKSFFSKIDHTKAHQHQHTKYHIHHKKFEKITILGIELIQPDFEREEIYGGTHETEFFLTFSMIASYEALKLEPHIIHGHDWQASYAIFDVKRQKKATKTLLTLHNLQYQGKAPVELLYRLGLSAPLSAWMLDASDQAFANLLKMGIESADRITTVSKTYHDEILDGSYSFGLEKCLLSHRHKFIGILNGIDYDYFNPFTDPLLRPHFPKKSLKDTDALKEAKLANLKSLLAEHNKPFDDRFTVCAISRLAEQKAPFLILYALKKTLELGGRFILVGSLHGSQEDDQIINVLSAYENHPHVLVELNTNSEMAHRCFASSSAIIVPSYFEPCGLTQLIALRYGTIPLVRETGGLKDTVFDLDTSQLSHDKRNGFTFMHPDEGGVNWVFDRCFDLYNNQKSRFYELAMKNLHEDHSWQQASKAYLELYEILSLNHQN